MLIDWFTVGAQALNFLILVWLLKRFLYTPIINAVDSREARIKKERADADAIKTAAEVERDDFHKKNVDLAQLQAVLLQKAKGEVAAERLRLMTQAQDAADALTAKRAKALETEARALDKSITDRARGEVFAIARKTLKDLADVGLEERICEAFIRRIEAFGEQPDSALLKAIQATADPIALRSAFELNNSQHAEIKSALHKTFKTDLSLTFATDRELIGGIEMIVGGQKLAWSISDYLSSLQTSVDAVLKGQEQAKIGQKATPKADPEVEPKTVKAPEKTSA